MRAADYGCPVAILPIETDGLRLRSGAGEAVLAIEAVIAWREWPEFWLLLTASNRFTILPTDRLPAVVLDTVRERLEEISRERC